MEFAELKVEERKRTGKNEARKLRAAGKAPAVIYGDGNEATPLIVDSKTLKSILQKEGHNVIFKLVGLPKSKNAMVKEIQRNPIKDSLIHVDFKIIALDEAIEAAVPLEILGYSIGVKEGGVLQQALREINIKALPNKIPEKIELDVSELNIGDALRVSDLPAFDSVEILNAPDDQVVSVVPPTELKEEELAPPAEGEEGAATEEAGEGAEETVSEGEAPPAEQGE